MKVSKTKMSEQHTPQPTPEHQVSTINELIKDKPIEEVMAEQARLAETGEFESTLLGIVGTIPNAEDFADDPNNTSEFDCPFENAAMLAIKDGAFDFSDNPGIGEKEKSEVERILGPVLLMVDADFRQRTGLEDKPGFVTRPSVTYRRGVVSEHQIEGDAILPHIDGYGADAGLLYFAAIGEGTKIYPGNYKLDGNEEYRFEFPEIIETVEAENIEPVTVDSGVVVAATGHVVHASPGAEAVGQHRSFLRVWYRPGDVLDQAATPEPTLAYASASDGDAW